jgi:chorismate synthase
VARKLIGLAGMSVAAWTAELGGVAVQAFDAAVLAVSPLGCPDAAAEKEMLARIEAARAAGDTLGGIVEIAVRGCPAGLGEPVFGRLDAELAAALMGIGTVKGVEIGAGFAAARMPGSVCNDPIGPQGFRTNHAGGILAGIATGTEIVLRAACKPIPSIALPQETIDDQGRPATVTVKGRHDVCVIPRIVPVCEAMVCLVLADHLLRQRALGGF